MAYIEPWQYERPGSNMWRTVIHYPGTAVWEPWMYEGMRWDAVPPGVYTCKYCSSTVKDGEIHYGKCPNCGAPMEL